LKKKTSKNTDEYNAGYDASKTVTASPLNPKNAAKDIERGKKLFEHTCAACHGTGGDGQGPIVQSGAFWCTKLCRQRNYCRICSLCINNGRNAMGSYAGQLTLETDGEAMYVMSAFKKGAAAPAAATAAAPATETTTETKK
jgi:mono/diheme cytochrome c family protein